MHFSILQSQGKFVHMHLANQSCDKIALKLTQFKKTASNNLHTSKFEYCMEKEGLVDKFSAFQKYCIYLAFNLAFSFDFLQDFKFQMRVLSYWRHVSYTELPLSRTAFYYFFL